MKGGKKKAKKVDKIIVAKIKPNMSINTLKINESNIPSKTPRQNF